MALNNSIWTRLCLAVATLMLFASVGHAQRTRPAPASAALARAYRADSLREATLRQQIVDDVRELLAAQRDSIVLLIRALADAEAAVAASDSAKTTAPSNTAALSPPTVNGTLQVQLTGGDGALRSTYRVRRAEIKVTTDLGRGSQAVLMLDAAKALSLANAPAGTTVNQNSRVLQDAYLVFQARRVQLAAGQQRLPLTYEGALTSGVLEAIDRTLMASDRARGGTFGDVRDLGVSARGTAAWFDYRAGVYDGSGETMSETDQNAGKAIIAQLGVRPSFLKDLRLGASGATSGRAAGDKPTRDRAGVDLEFNSGRALVQVEAMRGQDGPTQRAGGYAIAGVHVTPTLKLLARFDAWDPDLANESAAATVTERDYMAALTWLPFATRLKVQLNVVRKTYTRGLSPTVTQVLTQVQASW